MPYGSPGDQFTTLSNFLRQGTVRFYVAVYKKIPLDNITCVWKTSDTEAGYSVNPLKMFLL